MNNSMDVVYQFNEKYAPYAGASITSVITNNKDYDIRFHILGEDLTKDSISKLKSLESPKITFVFYNTYDKIEEMKQMGLPNYRNSYAANLRMFLPELLDQKIKRVLYLDADTIVTKDISELFCMNLESCCLAMVLDSLAGKHGVLIGMDEEDLYFNSGVILFDLEKWRNEKLTEKIVNHIKCVRASYPSPDQDLINIVCKNKILLLPIDYNFQPIHRIVSTKCYQRTFSQKKYYSNEHIENAGREAKILHCFRFLGEFPWHKDNLHPFLKEFDTYLSISPWSHYKKRKADCQLILKAEKVIYKILPHDIWGYIFYFVHSLFIYKTDMMCKKKQINKLM